MSISIVNRGGVSSSSGGGPSGGLKPELTVIAPAGSKLEISTGGSANGGGTALYNGVMLPQLPEWDKTAYPYASIVRIPLDDITAYMLTLTSKPQAISASYYVTCEEVFNMDCYMYLPESGYAEFKHASFFFGDEVQMPRLSIPAGELLYSMDAIDTTWAWSNHNVCLPNGSVFLAASDPVPVGGDKQIVDTYTLGENETEHTFTVDLGTYTVTGTLGEKSKSVDVVIDTVGQYSVQIDYKLWLYREGDECEDVTGGYSKVPIGTTTTNAAATKEAGRWYLDESMYYPNLISNNKINVTPYSKIYADIESTKSNKWHPWIGVLTARNIDDNYRALFMGIGTHGNEAGANRQIVSADIAAVTGDYYIGAALTGSGSAGYVYSFWLE